MVNVLDVALARCARCARRWQRPAVAPAAAAAAALQDTTSTNAAKTPLLARMDLRPRLVEACQTLSNLGLYQAAKWCAEALNGMEAGAACDYAPPPPSAAELVDHDRVLLARTYFSCKEFDRAAYVLKGCRSGNAVFLRLHAMLIAADRRLAEETGGTSVAPSGGGGGGGAAGVSGGGDTDSPLNATLLAILRETGGADPNPHLLYLRGVVYNRKRKYALAQASLYELLRLFPYNWLCWQELIASLATHEEAAAFLARARQAKLALAASVMFTFFEVVVLQEFYQQLEHLAERLQLLVKQFPRFAFVRVQEFLVAYHSLDYYQAETVFDQVLVQDPLRLDDLDTYSNMLYVMEKRLKLAYLAQFLLLVDKFRPETCCIVANYHLMKGEHEMAITYYKRALTLNRNCLLAWTLMGHEFVELKNSHAAIESYRRAVDTNPKDFRAWYGLGQAYEVLDMNMYALYYYQRATALQPLDKRMWQAIGNCYDKIDKVDEAVKSYERALHIDTCGDSAAADVAVDPHIAFKLASLLEKLGLARDTHHYMQMCLELEAEWGIGDDTSKARLWLARHALEARRYDDAYALAKDLSHTNAHDIEEARSIAREARSRMAR